MNPFQALFGGLLLLGAAFQVLTMFQVNSVASAVYESHMSDRQDPLRKRYSIEGDIKDNSAYSSNYLALVTPQVLSRNRTISIHAIAPISVFLKKHPEIDKNDEITLDVVSQIWLRNYAKEECKRLQATFAKECTVKRVRASVSKDKRHITAFINVRFTQSNLKVELDTEQKYTYGEHMISLSTSGRSNNLSWKTAQNERLKQYRKAGKICKKVARKSVLCGITSMSFSSSSRSNASIAWLLPS